MRLTTHREPRHLHGERADPHPCNQQQLGRQRHLNYYWAARLAPFINYMATGLLLLGGAAMVVMLMAW